MTPIVFPLLLVTSAIVRAKAFVVKTRLYALVWVLIHIAGQSILIFLGSSLLVSIGGPRMTSPIETTIKATAIAGFSVGATILLLTIIDRQRIDQMHRLKPKTSGGQNGT